MKYDLFFRKLKHVWSFKKRLFRNKAAGQALENACPVPF